MKRLCLRMLILGALCFFPFCPTGLGQDQSAQPQQAQPSPQPQPRHVPVFGNADEFAIGGDFEYYEPLPGFNRENRDIDLQVSTLALAAHMGNGWEFQFDGLALRAEGYRTLPSGAPTPQIPSDALGLAGGPLARWNFLQFSRFRPFVEAEGDFILFDRPWPTLGTVNDFFLRAGGGVSVRVSKSYWIEPTFHFAHISNGECFCTINPTWDGRGFSLGLRRAFTHEPEGANKPERWPFRDANEKGWITSVEDYTPTPGLNREDGAVEADMRQLRISRAWNFPDRLEFQLGGSVQTTNTVFGIGPVLRWNFVEHERWRLFSDGGADLLQTGSPAFINPIWKGLGYNLFPRERGGVSVQLHASYWLEGSFGWAQVTSGYGADKLLPWSGQGASLGLRHTFGSHRS